MLEKTCADCWNTCFDDYRKGIIRSLARSDTLRIGGF
jgi:hypothetical protein